MKPGIPAIFLAMSLILFVLFLPVLLGSSMVDIPDEDDFADEGDFWVISNILVPGTLVLFQERMVVLRLGLSMFTLFVVFVGGRLKHKRFNDRTIDHVNVFPIEFFKTALIRAVFNFLLCAQLQVGQPFHPAKLRRGIPARKRRALWREILENLSCQTLILNFKEVVL